MYLTKTRVRVYPRKAEALSGQLFRVKSRSVVFRFYEPSRADLGAVIESIEPVDGMDLTFDMGLRFWEDSARDVVRLGASFTAWAGEDLGEGTVVAEPS